jgi:hypothetical protein
MDSIIIFIYRQDLPGIAKASDFALRATTGQDDPASRIYWIFYSLFPDEAKNTYLPSARQLVMYDMILSSTEGGLLFHQFLQEIDEKKILIILFILSDLK